MTIANYAIVIEEQIEVCGTEMATILLCDENSKMVGKIKFFAELSTPQCQKEADGTTTLSLPGILFSDMLELLQREKYARWLVDQAKNCFGQGC